VGLGCQIPCTAGRKIFIMIEVTGKGRACIPGGLCRWLNQLNKVCLKSRRKKKNSMTGPGHPQTCSHLIYARTLTGVHQAVRYFSSCYFHAFVFVLFPYSTLH